MYDITLDTKKGGFQAVLEGFVVGDTNTRSVCIRLMQGLKPYPLPLNDDGTANYTATLFIKSAAASHYSECTEYPDRIEHTFLTSEIEEGFSECEIKIVSAGKVLTSAKFKICAEAPIQDDSAIAAENSFSALTSALAEVQSVSAGLQSKVDKVKGATAGNLASFDGEGGIEDSGVAAGEVDQIPSAAIGKRCVLLKNDEFYEGIVTNSTAFSKNLKVQPSTGQLYREDDPYLTYGDAGQLLDAKQDKTITDEGSYYSSDTVEGALQELGEALDKFTYVSPTVTLTVGGANSTEELGKVLASVTVSATANKECKTLKLYSGNTLLQSAEKATSVSATVENVSTTTTFKAVAVDKYDKEITKTHKITFCNGVYYGAGTAATLDNATKALKTSRAITFTVTAGEGEYVFYACPTAYGTPKFSVGGFEGGFSKTSTANYTNESGYTESYDLWQSDEPSLGTVTVVVS